MKIKIILVLLIAIIVNASCNKGSDFNYPAGTVGISKIVYFPLVSTIGARLMIIPQGSSFTDPGVDATLNSQPVTPTITGSVDPTTPGVYVINYSASNPQGFSASDFRTVVVIGTDVAANDFSGTYLRAATGVTSTWTKDSTGVYTVENPGGAGVGAGETVIVVNYSGSLISIPQQISPDFGLVSSSSETYNATASPVTYSWIFHAGGYGTSLRTFTKQ
jgi:surface protein with Ig-like domain